MNEISAQLVRSLRQRTGLGMMECKKALVDANGDIDTAEQALRIKSGVKANKLAGRIAAEGVIGIWIDQEAKTSALVELNCETDFVAKNEEFSNFAEQVAKVVANENFNSVEELADFALDGENVEKVRQNLIMKLGENISIRRFSKLKAQDQIACYRHGVKIGVIVDYQGDNPQLGKDLAMQIAASKPIWVSENEIPSEIIAKEKEIYRARALESGKPENIVEKIIEGNLKKYFSEVTLLGQPFVKDPDQTISNLLQSQKAKVNSFLMYIVGEGIEKKSSDFASEVAATVASSYK